MEIGTIIKKYRIIKALSQEELSALAGINEKYYGKVERGESVPTVDTLKKICDALKIEISELFLFNLMDSKNEFSLDESMIHELVNNLKRDIDIHFNRNVLISGCLSSIWYNGYIGSMSFDEFELLIFAEGNIKGELFLDYKKVIEFNSSDICNELRKYINNDHQLKRLIEYMTYDKAILKSHKGNAFFVTESNWFSAILKNNSTNETIDNGIILDADSILDVMGNYSQFFDYIYKG